MDKWFYFQKFNVLFGLNTITGFWEGRDAGCAGMMGFYVCYGVSFWCAMPTAMTLRLVGAGLYTCDFRWAIHTALILRPVGAEVIYL